MMFNINLLPPLYNLCIMLKLNSTSQVLVMNSAGLDVIEIPNMRENRIQGWEMFVGSITKGEENKMQKGWLCVQHFAYSSVISEQLQSERGLNF